MKGSESKIESESEKGRAVGWGGGRDCCWWLGCTRDIRRYLRANKMYMMYDVIIGLRPGISSHTRRRSWRSGKGRVYVPGRGMEPRWSPPCPASRLPRPRRRGLRLHSLRRRILLRFHWCVCAFVTCYFFIDAFDQTNILYVSNKPSTLELLS